MKRIWKIICVVLAVLLIVTGVVGYFYIQNSLEMAYKKGYDVCEKKLQPEIDRLNKELIKAPKPLRNPTRQELIEFLKRDQTNKKDLGTAYHFTTVLRENAIKEGIRAGFTIFSMKDFLNAAATFETTDEGLTYVDAGTDKIVKLIIGQSYYQLNDWPKKDFNDTIAYIFDPIW